MLIDPESANLECYRLNQQGRWELFQYTNNTDSSNDINPEQIEFASVDLTFSFEQLYEDVELI